MSVGTIGVPNMQNTCFNPTTDPGNTDLAKGEHRNKSLEHALERIVAHTGNAGDSELLTKPPTTLGKGASTGDA